MQQSRLALDGGRPVIDRAIAPYASLGRGEREAVDRVMNRGCLSGFYGSWGEHFMGGPEIKALEAAWCERFQVRHAVSVNSATSGLFAAMAAVGIRPGDEVIVPPLTMSATVMAPLVYGGVPVFADLEPDTFCLDPAKVESLITTRTKAIIVVNLFGHPAALQRLRKISDERGIALIEDNAQSPLATEHDRLAGTVGDIGIFSLNYHKHIHSGEGGICVTADSDLYHRLCMIRNHGENVVDDIGIDGVDDLIGFNYRLTELSAAIANSQLSDVCRHVHPRVELAEQLTEAIQGVSGVTAPVVREGCSHVYYVWALRFDADEFGCSRELFSRALSAEGFPHGVGYVPPLYRLPIFQRTNLVNRWLRDESTSPPAHPTHSTGSCPVAESLHGEQLVLFEPCQFDCSDANIGLFCEAIRKVCDHRDELSKWEQSGPRGAVA